jgi:hypothetical protein
VVPDAWLPGRVIVLVQTHLGPSIYEYYYRSAGKQHSNRCIRSTGEVNNYVVSDSTVVYVVFVGLDKSVKMGSDDGCPLIQKRFGLLSNKSESLELYRYQVPGSTYLRESIISRHLISL